MYGQPKVFFPRHMETLFGYTKPFNDTRDCLLDAKSSISKYLRGMQKCQAYKADYLVGQHMFNNFTADLRNA